MHENSLSTYREEAGAGRLSKRCSEIMEILERIGQGTDREIFAASKYLSMANIQPRISELVKGGWLEEFDNIQDPTTGKTVRVVRIADRARRQDSTVRPEATPLCQSAAVTSAQEPAFEPATCSRCKGAGRRRVPGSDPAVFSFCDELFDRPCRYAERRRRINGDPNHDLSSSELEVLAR